MGIMAKHRGLPFQNRLTLASLSCIYFHCCEKIASRSHLMENGIFLTHGYGEISVLCGGEGATEWLHG